jgi:hypothetical protein
MKLNGEVAGIKKAPIPFRRGDKRFVFWAVAQESFEPFNDLCPLPEPPTYKTPGGTVVKNTQDPGYQRSMEARNERFVNWLVVQSLTDGTPEIEWEEVKLEDFETWHLWTKELRSFGLSEMELAHVVNKVSSVNDITDDDLDKEVEDFLSETQGKSNDDPLSDSQDGDQKSILSGELAKLVDG